MNEERGLGMTLMERFNLNWLAHAMTDAPNSNIHYYYDSRNTCFFHVKAPASYDDGIEFYDAMGLELSQQDYQDLFLRLITLPDTSDEIVEIGKLGAAQKRDIQWQFLNRFCTHKYHFKYFVAVIDQPENEHFVLDRLITGEDNPRLLSIWEKFKLEVIRIYANNFAHNLGIELNLMA